MVHHFWKFLTIHFFTSCFGNVSIGSAIPQNWFGFGFYFVSVIMPLYSCYSTSVTLQFFARYFNDRNRLSSRLFSFFSFLLVVLLLFGFLGRQCTKPRPLYVECRWSTWVWCYPWVILRYRRSLFPFTGHTYLSCSVLGPSKISCRSNWSCNSNNLVID